MSDSPNAIVMVKPTPSQQNQPWLGVIWQHPSYSGIPNFINLHWAWFIPSGKRLQFAIENCHRNCGFTHWKWWFSIVMLIYQRVIGFTTLWTCVNYVSETCLYKLCSTLCRETAGVSQCLILGEPGAQPASDCIISDKQAWNDEITCEITYGIPIMSW
jgi:hypothetical protein